MRAIEGCWSRAVVVGLALGLLRACSLDTEAPVGPCQDDTAVCDDGNPCTDDLCAGDGFCEHAPAAFAPDDGNPCTADVCADVEEEHIRLPDGTACGLGGEAQCVAGKCLCSVDTDCGENTACTTFTCELGSCRSENAPNGTFVGGGDAGDCRYGACDGQGNVVAVADDGDVPADDQNVCTIEGCSGGMAIDHENVDDGTECGPGSCGGSDPSFQASAPAVCFGGVCTMSGTTACDLYDCNDDGSACRDTCAADSACTSVAYCETSQATCLAKLGTGSPCKSGNQCSNGQCSDGYCCDGSCNGVCERCDLLGLQGTCTISAGQQEGCAAGQVCTADGGCKKPNGATCTIASECVNGFCPTEGGGQRVCCDKACSGVCQSCRGSKTGQVDGVCAFIASKTDPDNECAGGCGFGTSGCCDGNGTCND